MYVKTKENKEIMHSKDLETFLSLLRTTEEQHNIHYDNVNKCDREQQNLLHDFELLDLNYNQRAKKATELKKTRLERRYSKDIVEMTSEVVQFCKDNRQFIQKTERLLGDLRKKEKDLENRVYKRR